jgi:hypothetical protein
LFAALPGFWVPAIDNVSGLEAWRLLQQHFLFLILYAYILLFIFSVIVLMIYPHPSLQKRKVWDAVVAAVQRFPLIVAVCVMYQVLCALGLVLFVLPGIYISLLLVFAFPYVIVEKMNPIQALFHSGELVWPHWWRTFWVFTVAMLIYVVSLVVIHGLFYVLFSEGMGQVSFALRHFVDVIMGALYLPFFCSTVIVQFNDLKLRQLRNS